jgi:superfamily II DNA/RNA helicase
VPPRAGADARAELAAQVAASAEDYGRFVRLRTLVIFGGVSESRRSGAALAATC